MPKPIDKDYFKNYAGNSNYSYCDNYAKHSGIKNCLDVATKLELKNVYVLGCATGKVLEEFEKAGIQSSGCELSNYAYDLIPSDFRSRVDLGDMRMHVSRLRKEARHYDLIFTNSLVYLSESELPNFVKKCAQICSYLHFYSSFVGHSCVDDYRVTLKTYLWWVELFNVNGFGRTGDPFLFKSKLSKT